MAKEEVHIDPRFLKYNTEDVEALLGRVESMKTATDEDIRTLVNGEATGEP